MTTRFIIVGAPRTGSTLLVRTLNAIDGIRCHGELLGDAVRGYEDGFDPVTASPEQRQQRSARLLRERDGDAGAFIRAALADTSRATGFKTVYHQFLNPRWQPVLAALLAGGGLRAIHLVRANSLRRYVSEEIAKAGGPIHSGAGGRADVPMQVHVDIDDFRASAAHSEAERHRVDALLAGTPVLETSYEQLAADTPATVAAVCAFLGITVAPDAVQPALAKVGAADLRNVVSNYDELLAHDDTRALAQRD